MGTLEEAMGGNPGFVDPATENVPPVVQEATVGKSFSETESDKKRLRIRKKLLGTAQLQIPLTAPGVTTGDIPSGSINI